MHLGKEHIQSCPEIATAAQTNYACCLSSDLICTVKLRGPFLWEAALAHSSFSIWISTLDAYHQKEDWYILDQDEGCLIKIFK